MVFTDQQKTDIYNDYSPKVMAYIKGKIANQAEAEDLHSEVFTKIIKNLDKFDPEKASISTWIYHITQNTVYDYFRTYKSTAELVEGVDYEPEIEVSVEDSICREETLEELADALEKLSEQERKIIILRYYEGMQLKEIGEYLKISYSYVRLLHNKALDQLKELMTL